MLTQLQLEGPELEPLLDRVRSELGPGARIVQAEKVRTGGVAGFFARQRFELTVEVDGDVVTAPAAAGAPLSVTSATAAAPAPRSLLELADRVSETESEQASAVSTESASFASLLSRLGSALGGGAGAPTPAIPTPATPVPATPVPATPTPARAVPVQRSGDDAPVAPGRPRPTPGPTAAPSTTALTAPAPGTDDAPATTSAWDRALAVRPASDVVLPASRADSASFPRSRELAVRLPEERALVRCVPTVTASVTVPVPALPPVDGPLVRLGLPAHLLPEGTGDLHPALLESLRRLPKVPRTTNRAGAVLAVVGPLPLALDVAREIAIELGLRPSSALLLATTAPGATGLPEAQVLGSPSAAADKRPGWKRRKNLTIVVVDAPLTGAGAAQARAFLAAVDPTSTWGVVEATRKWTDVGAWARALGGVHALALTGVEETADPAAVLQLGIPVGRLGSAPATPAAWASLLTGRLAA